MEGDVFTVNTMGGVAVVTFDDGKVNTISPQVLAAFSEILDAVESDPATTALVLAGRDGQFSAGFDLATIMGGGKARNDLVEGGWNLLLRLVEVPLPLVIACTGNAVAAGAALLLTGDLRIGSDGAFKIGFNEVGIGMPLPGSLSALAEARLSASEVFAATAGARLYAPVNAAQAGYLHDVVTPGEVVETAVSHASRLSALPQDAFAMTKSVVVEATGAAMRSRIARDREYLERIGG